MPTSFSVRRSSKITRASPAKGVLFLGYKTKTRKSDDGSQLVCLIEYDNSILDTIVRVFIS